MLVRELLESIYEIKPEDMKLQVRVKYVPLRYFGVPKEESDYFARQGIDIDRFGSSTSNQQGKIPVAYAAIASRKNKHFLDSLKDNKGHYVDKNALQKMMNDAVVSIADIGEVDRKIHEQGIDEIRDALTSPKAILLVTPSRQSIVVKVAETISRFLHHKIVNAFKKNPRQEVSQYKYTIENGYEHAPIRLKTSGDEYYNKIIELQKQTEKQILYWRNMLARSRSPEAIKDIESKIEEIKATFEEEKAKIESGVDTGEAKKQAYGQGDQRRLLNSFIKTNDAAELNGKDVIIVDNNVDSGGTIARLTTAMLKAGIQPKSVSAIVILALK